MTAEQDGTLSEQYNAETERTLLGAILSAPDKDQDLVAAVINLLKGGTDFYHPKHTMIFNKIKQLFEDGQIPRPLTVMEMMDARELSMTQNGVYVIECSALGSIVEGQSLARQLRRYAAKRDMVTTLTASLARVQATPVVEVETVYREIQDRVSGLEVAAGRTALVHQSVVNDQTVDWIQRAEERKGAPVGALSGWPDLDNILKGLGPGQVCVVAGRPGMGKSTWARNYIYNTAIRQRMPAAFFSLEMSQLEIGLCMLSAGSGVPLTVLQDGTLTDDDWVRVARCLGETNEAPLYYDETPGTTLAQMEAGMRHVINVHGSIKLVAFDYLQLHPTGNSRQDRQAFISEISRNVKILAKRYECPIILVSQLNRGSEGRTDKRPQMSDLRESGSIEQDADIVVLLHRDEYYDKESDRAGEADFIVAKHRNGPTDTITVAAQLHLSRFMSMAIVD